MGWGLLRKPVVFPEMGTCVAGEPGSRVDTPAEARLFLWQVLTHGAKAVQWCFWRGHPDWIALMQKNFKPTPAAKEISKELKEINRFKSLLAASDLVESKIGLVYSWRNVEVSNLFYDSCINEFVGAYLLLRELGYETDIVPLEEPDLMKKYDILIIPSLRVVRDKDLTSISGYIKEGKTVLITARTGEFTENHEKRSEPLSIFGIKILNRTDKATKLITTAKDIGKLNLEFNSIYEEMETGGKVLSKADNFPLIIDKKIGEGRLIYIGTHIFEEPDKTGALLGKQPGLQSKFRSKEFLDNLFTYFNLPDMVITENRKGSKIFNTEARLFKNKDTLLLMFINLGKERDIRIRLPEAKGEVYDLIRHKRVETIQTKNGLVIDTAFREKEGRAFIIIPDRLREIKFQAKSTKEGILYQIRTLGVKSSIPVMIEVENPIGKDYRFSRSILIDGYRKEVIKLSKYDKVGKWKIKVFCPLTGEERRSYVFFEK